MQISFFAGPDNVRTPGELSLFSCIADHTSIITCNSILDLLTHTMAD